MVDYENFWSLSELQPSFVWHPEDQHATKPPNICSIDKHGKYYVEYDKAPDGSWVFHGEFIDTRIPYDYRVKIANNEMVNMSYIEWESLYGED